MDFKFDTLIELIRTFPDEQSCIEYLEDIIWNGKPVSPFDPTSKVYKCKNGKYKCKNTGKYFTIKTGTIFAGTKVKLQDWFVAIWLDATHKGGLSSMQLMRDLKRTQKTTWFMLHRARRCKTRPPTTPHCLIHPTADCALTGTVVSFSDRAFAETLSESNRSESR